MKTIVCIITFTFLIIFPVSSFARSGCCSHHGGVCGGICCDGSPLSYVCGGGVPDFTYTPYIIPTSIAAPKINGTFETKPNLLRRTFTTTVYWDLPQDTPVSIALQKTVGGDPGPNIDTTSGYYTFNEVPSGTWYVNMKLGENGFWSPVTYWTINVPEWYPPEPVLLNPTPTPTRKPLLPKIFWSFLCATVGCEVYDE